MFAFKTFDFKISSLKKIVQSFWAKSSDHLYRIAIWKVPERFLHTNKACLQRKSFAGKLLDFALSLEFRNRWPSLNRSLSFGSSVQMLSKFSFHRTFFAEESSGIWSIRGWCKLATFSYSKRFKQELRKVSNLEIPDYDLTCKLCNWGQRSIHRNVYGPHCGHWMPTKNSDPEFDVQNMEVILEAYIWIWSSCLNTRIWSSECEAPSCG